MSKRSNLTLVTDIQSKFRPEDIASLDMVKLRDEMVKSIYALECSLFSQATYEYQRISNLRELTSKLETELFSDEALRNLSPKDKIYMYGLLMNNMQRSMQFMQSLHQNVTSGIDVINQIEKMKTEKPGPENLNNESLSQVKALILSKIQEKNK